MGRGRCLRTSTHRLKQCRAGLHDERTNLNRRYKHSRKLEGNRDVAPLRRKTKYQRQVLKSYQPRILDLANTDLLSCGLGLHLTVKM